MTIKEALFSSTEKLKMKTRGEIRAWFWPMKIAQAILMWALPIYFTISTYYTEAEIDHKLGAIAYLIVGFILLMMYSRLKRSLQSWETNKRVKFIMLTLVKLIPVLALIFIVSVIGQNTIVFMAVMDKVIACFAGSLVLDFFTGPLSTELRIRDKIKLNTETGRIID